MTAERFVVRYVICASLLFSLFLYSCGSTRRSVAADYASDVADVYYGAGKLWKPGDVKDVVITLTRVNDTTATANIEATLPAALRQMSGRQTMTGNLTVSPDHELTGTIKLFIFKLTVTGSSVNPTAHTIVLNYSGNLMGHPLNFELTGGPDPPDHPIPPAPVIPPEPET